MIVLYCCRPLPGPDSLGGLRAGKRAGGAGRAVGGRDKWKNGELREPNQAHPLRPHNCASRFWSGSLSLQQLSLLAVSLRLSFQQLSLLAVLRLSQGASEHARGLANFTKRSCLAREYE